jgi:hypothetical protein
MNSKALLRQASQIAGGIWISGRHNRGAGFITDIEKYNPPFSSTPTFGPKQPNG